MKLDRIHQIAEIIASVAIVASLVFVGLQVSQNTDALKFTAAATNASNWQNLLIARATDKEVLQTFLSAGIRPEGVPVQDLARARLGHFLTAELKSAEQLYLQWLDGNLSDELWQTNRHGLIWGLAQSPDYWDVLRGGPFFRGNWTPAFQALIDELLPEVNAIRAGLKVPPLLPLGAEPAASEAAS